MANTSRAAPTHPSRIASDGLDASLAIYLVVYSIAAACFAVGLYALLQPSKSPNPGTATYNPPPGTVISYVAPTRSRTPPETDGRATAAAEPASTIGLAEQAPKAAAESGAPAKTDVPAKTEDVKAEAKPRHQAHRERRPREWGFAQPSIFNQHRPWY
jgi:hypothetical protein